MEDKSKNFITQEDERVAKLRDAFSAINASGNINIDKIEMGATREDFEKLSKWVIKELTASNKRMNQIEREIERLQNNKCLTDKQEEEKDKLDAERDKLLDKQQNLLKIKEDFREEIERERIKKAKQCGFLLCAVAACLIAVLAICCVCDVRCPNGYFIAVIVLMCVSIIIFFLLCLFIEDDIISYRFLLGIIGVVGVLWFVFSLSIMDAGPISSLRDKMLILFTSFNCQGDRDASIALSSLFSLFFGCILIIIIFIAPIYMAVDDGEPVYLSAFFTQITLIGIVLVLWISKWFWILAILGVAASTISYVIGEYADDPIEIVISLVYNLIIMIIGYAIGTMVETAFPDYFFNSFLIIWG